MSNFFTNSVTLDGFERSSERTAIHRLRVLILNLAMPIEEVRQPATRSIGACHGRTTGGTMRHPTIILVIGALCLSFAAPASAAERGWHLRAFAAGFDPDLDVLVPSENPDEVRVTADSALGFGAGLEYQFTDLLGLELGFMSGSPEIGLSADVPGFGLVSLKDPMSTLVITLDLDLHVLRNSRLFDLYLGGGMASVGYGDLHFVDPEGDALDLDASDDFTFSAKVGLDIILGENSRWRATGGLRYVWSDLEVSQVEPPNESSVTLDFDLFNFTVGFGYSF